MQMPRKFLLALACLSLGGCITYTDGGYYSSPDVNSYYGDDYYGSNNNDYDGYYGNYGQYEYYGIQPSITFNFFNYGYSGYQPYYGYYNGYSNYYPCNSWSSYCYAYRPSYGWGYWPVYVYRPPNHHHDNDHHDDDHYGHNNDHNNSDHNNNGHNNDNGPKHPKNEPVYSYRNRPNQALPQVNNNPTRPIRGAKPYKTPSIPLGNNPSIAVTPDRPTTTNRPVDAEKVLRYRAPNNNVKLSREQVPERAEQVEVNEQDANQYHGVATYTVQQPAYSREGMPEQAERQRRYNNAERQNRIPPPQPVKGGHYDSSKNNVTVVQQQQAQPQPQQAQPQPQQQPQQQSQPQQASKSERRESRKSKNEQDD